MHERLDADTRHRGVNRAEVVDRVLPGHHDTRDTQVSGRFCAGNVVHRHLRRAVDLELRVHRPNQSNESEVLHDDGVNAAMHRRAQELERRYELRWLDEHIQGVIDPRTVRVRDGARALELIKGELGTVVPRVEATRPEIDRVGTIGHGRADGIEGARWCEEFGDTPIDSARATRRRNLALRTRPPPTGVGGR